MIRNALRVRSAATPGDSPVRAMIRTPANRDLQDGVIKKENRCGRREDENEPGGIRDERLSEAPASVVHESAHHEPRQGEYRTNQPVDEKRE